MKLKPKLPQQIKKGMQHGIGIVLGMGVTTLLAVTVSSIATFSDGDLLSAASINTNFSNLRTAIESIPGWAKGTTTTDAVYTAGNVGIGTTAPSHALHIQGSTATTSRMAVENTGTTTSDYAAYYAKNPTSQLNMGIEDSNGSGIITGSTGYAGTIGTTGAYPLQFGTSDSVRMTIASDGKVGIGTTSPINPLHVNGNDNNLYAAFIKQTGGTGAGLSGGLAIYTANTGTSADPANTALRIWNDNGANSIFLVHNSGKVGIGTTSPDQLLSVNGNASKSGGGSWATFSDRRLKDFDRTFPYGLEEIEQLNPYFYYYKKDNKAGIKDLSLQLGMTAQDLQKLMPEGVSINSKGYLMMNMDPVIWASVNSIKELSNRSLKQKKHISDNVSSIQKLKNENLVLKQRLEKFERMEHRLARLERKLSARLASRPLAR